MILISKWRERSKRPQNMTTDSDMVERVMFGG